MFPEQRRFVASIEQSLADASADDHALFRLACVDETPVGYVLLRPARIDRYRLVNVTRLMIDRRFQGRGYGRRLLEAVLAWVEELEPPIDIVRISVVLDNERALQLYETAGFTPMGVEDGELALYRATEHIRRR